MTSKSLVPLIQCWISFLNEDCFSDLQCIRLIEMSKDFHATKDIFGFDLMFINPMSFDRNIVLMLFTSHG